MAEVQLTVKQVSSQTRVQLNLTLEPVGGGEPTASPQDVRSTGEAIIGSISSLAEQDPTGELREERDNLQFEQTDGEESEGGRYGRQDFKDSFRRIGDKIQREVDKYTSRITLQEDPGQVIASLRQELNDLFDVKNGKGEINSGRLMMALYLNYCLIVKYYKRYGRAKLVPLLVQLVPSLVKYFIGIGLITWIIMTGGWVILREVTKADALISASFALFPRLTIIGGIGWILYSVVTRYFWC